MTGSQLFDESMERAQETELAALRARVAAAEAKQALDQRQCDDMTEQAGKLAARVAELERQVAALADALEMLRNEDNCWCDGPEKDRRGETDMTTHYGYCSEIRAALRAAGRKT